MLYASKKFSKQEKNKDGKIEYTWVFEAELESHSGQRPYFSITGTQYRGVIQMDRNIISCGCIHDDFERLFPEWAYLLKWHLVSLDSPMHYLANTLYHASNRDYNGLLEGETRQLINGKSKKPSWKLAAVDSDGNEIEIYKLDKYQDSDTAPECPYELKYVSWNQVGKGKEREFDAARSFAVWPDATDEQLSLPEEELKQLLIDRIPALMAEFDQDMNNLFGQDTIINCKAKGA